MGMTKAFSPSGRDRVRAAKVKAKQYILTLALSLFITAPAAAQTTATITLSVTGNNSDRDSTWDGLQVNEGDTISFILTSSVTMDHLGIPIVRFTRSGSAYNTNDLRLPTGRTPSAQLSGEASLVLTSGNRVTEVRYLVVNDDVEEGDEHITMRMVGTSDRLLGADTPVHVLGEPRAVTVTIRGNNVAPAFRDSVTAQVFPNNTPISLTIPEATGGNGPVSYTATNLPAGLSFQGACGTRTLCGTPTTLGTTTIEITAADADCNPGGTTGLDCSMATTATAMADTDTLSFSIQIADAYHLADINQNGSLDTQDALLMYQTYLEVPGVDDAVMERTRTWQENGRAQGGDLNSDGPINHRDALIMYYAYEFGDLLDQSAVLRQLLLNGVRGRMPDTDATYRELLRRARGLR